MPSGYGREARTYVQGFGLKVVALSLRSLKLPATKLHQQRRQTGGTMQTPNLTTIAGGDAEAVRQREECIAELRPVVRGLRGRGYTVEAIVSALAVVTLYTLDGSNPGLN
jgi:hypothetical protein